MYTQISFVSICVRVYSVSMQNYVPYWESSSCGKLSKFLNVLRHPCPIPGNPCWPLRVGNEMATTHRAASTTGCCPKLQTAWLRCDIIFAAMPGLRREHTQSRNVCPRKAPWDPDSAAGSKTQNCGTDALLWEPQQLQI